MNYARISDRPFITSKDIKKKCTMSQEAKVRWDYIESHNFSVSIDPITSNATLKVTPKDDKE